MGSRGLKNSDFTNSDLLKHTLITYMCIYIFEIQQWPFLKVKKIAVEIVELYKQNKNKKLLGKSFFFLINLKF